MSKILLLKGLPASGKTSYARQLIKDNPGVYKRINKDELRAMLDAGEWSTENEKFILKIRDELVIKCLAAGYSVIVDDTNLHLKHEARMRQLAQADPEMGLEEVEVEIKEFSTSVDECIKRDSMRANGVGAKVIRQMYRQFLRKGPPVLSERIMNVPDAIICDMDGTLALMNGRSPYDVEKCKEDLVNHSVAEIVREFHLSNNRLDGRPSVHVIIVSGRDDIYKEHTREWLITHGIPHNGIYMRRATDKRDDTIVKKEIYETYIKGKFNVLFVLDDRSKVVDMWREQGLTCLQVAEGEF